MFQGYSLAAVAAVFIAAAAAIWYAGIRLVDATDILDDRWRLGEALGGTLLLAIATNLPELAITASAAWSGNVGVAVGNILGGIAIQTVILAVLDFRMQNGGPLTRRAASLPLILEGLAVVAILGVCIMATQLPPSLIFDRLTPGPVLVALVWIAGVWLIGRANEQSPADPSGEPGPGALQAAWVDGTPSRRSSPSVSGGSTARAVWIFIGASVVTLVAGVILERASDVIAERTGMSGVLFGATVLAAATALPELSTGLRAIAKGDYRLAVSDIFGGNAFLPVLFLLATLLSGQAVLPRASESDIYLAGLGILLTCVYLAGLVFRPSHRITAARIGPDSLAALVFYGVGMAGLCAMELAA
ncbi:MAG: hypothetical protein QHC78_08550 [Pigmentiphaga sp.]|uniref:sodium:calcium antiporter n=1 Tax=Pigmentiphaga sp. TaxID=1977564 RepID=UPI0029BBDE74|nr:hypothetical protein [Pigmentiphaga sp.]MDX3905721.1 hypothetical protein [Pigmentiphaga sp.]